MAEPQSLHTFVKSANTSIFAITIFNIIIYKKLKTDDTASLNNRVEHGAAGAPRGAGAHGVERIVAPYKTAG